MFVSVLPKITHFKIRIAKYSPTRTPRILQGNWMCLRMLCSNVKKKGKIRLLVYRLIGTAVDGVGGKLLTCLAYGWTLL